MNTICGATYSTKHPAIQEMPGKRTLKQYRLQGYYAKTCGFTQADNPYIPSSSAHANWLRGLKN